ncbi:hypothetical protein [Candidimonas nitroreducens]|uniref:hypothetical protein n=1 Tax=Candidimonas nitroreducens TaxID=683354 RepID=UPI0011773928|nr:hypothetical protein [Candidimonas nitroreducens]
MSSDILLLAARQPSAPTIGDILFGDGVTTGAVYDLTDFSTLKQSDGSSITAVGQTVSKVYPKYSGTYPSGPVILSAASGIKLSQDSDGCYRLNYPSSSVNGLYSPAFFSATASISVVIGSLTGYLSYPFYIFTAMTSSSNEQGWELEFVPGSGMGWGYWDNGGSNVGNFKGGSYSITTKSVMTLRATKSSLSSVTARSNGTNASLSTYASATISSTPVSTQIFLGKPYTSGFNTKNFIYSFIVYGGILSSDKLAAAEAWVNERTGAY